MIFYKWQISKLLGRQKNKPKYTLLDLLLEMKCQIIAKIYPYFVETPPETTNFITSDVEAFMSEIFSFGTKNVSPENA